MGFYLQGCFIQVLNESCASGCTSLLLHDSCAPHWKQFPGTNWKHDKNARGKLFDDCWIVGGFCRKVCLMLDQILPCSTDSQCGEGIGEGEKQKRWLWGATKPQCFHMISDISYCRVPTGLSVVHITCYFWLGQLPKRLLGVKLFSSFVPEEAPVNERRIRGHGFSMIFYRFPSSTFHQCCTSVGQQARLEEQQKRFEDAGILPSKMFELSIEQTGASGCTPRLLHDSCAAHPKPISRNKLEGWQCKRRAVWFVRLSLQADCLVLVVTGLVSLLAWMIQSVVKELEKEKSKTDEFEVQPTHLLAIVVSYDFGHFIFQKYHNLSILRALHVLPSKSLGVWSCCIFGVRRSSNPWKKHPRPWVFHDFLELSHFTFCKCSMNFSWVAGATREE